MRVQDFDISTLKGITQDSRSVRAGYLFAAFAGQNVDGRRYIGRAIEAGAMAILVKKGTVIEGAEIIVIEDENPRKAYAEMAAAFHSAQPECVVAVTGTNGKTSVVGFAQQLWEAVGLKAQSLGTLSGAMTTPDAGLLQEDLSAMAQEGITHLALEASSHGLDQYRLDGVKISAAGFTNFSRDHLDYHEDMGRYLAAKMRLFTEILSEGGCAVLNADVPEFEKLMDVYGTRGISLIDYGVGAQDLKIVSAVPTSGGQAVQLGLWGRAYEIDFPLVGDFQLMNALCALGLVLSEEGADAQEADYVRALESLKGVRGRLQNVSGHPQGAEIYVDYAHTPDALEHALTALRPHTKGRLICVFGCGGDRDHGKRALMGAVAQRLADEVIVTDDNPRSEDPSSIRADIMEGNAAMIECSPRREAVKRAVSDLIEGDVLLLAGKGHEQGQVFADHTDPFDDVDEVKKAINALKEREQ